MNNQTLSRSLRRQLATLPGETPQTADATSTADNNVNNGKNRSARHALHRYQDLVSDFCDCRGLNDHEGILDGDHFYIDGSSLFLDFEPEGMADYCLIFCELCDSADLSGEQKSIIYPEMLQVNGMARDGNGPMLGLSPDTEILLYMMRFAIGNGTGRGQILAQTASSLAKLADTWRQTCLSDTPQSQEPQDED